MSYVKPRSNINRKKNMYGWNEEEKEKILFFICFEGGKRRNDESKPVRKMVVLEPSP